MSELQLHLTEEQMDDALIGDLGAEAAAHLKGCAACTARLAEAEMPLVSFRTLTTAWSERRSATMPAIVVQGSRMSARGRLLAWSAALSALIVAGVAVPVALHQAPARSETAQVAPAVQAAGASGATASTSIAAVEVPAASNLSAPTQHGSVNKAASQDKISQDNAMLMDIDRELDATNATRAVLTLEQPHGPLAKPQTIDE